MSENGIGRRTFLKAGVAALGAARVLQSREAFAQVVPNSEADRHRILVQNPQAVYGFPRLG